MPSRKLCSMLLACLCSCLCLDAKPRTVVPKEIYEEWWDHCLDNTVPMQTFAGWIGDANSPSRVAMRKTVVARNYKSLLDIPSGLCIDFFGLKQDKIAIKYSGVDICKKLVDMTRALGVDVMHGSIEKIPHKASKFDIVYSRHILEHLPYYETAVNELIRVAKKEVLIVFFIKLGLEDIYNYNIADDHYIYHNCYSKEKFEKFVKSNKKVASLEWETVNEKEEIVHIYMTQ